MNLFMKINILSKYTVIEYCNFWDILTMYNRFHLVLSNPADAQNVSCLGLCGRDICPKSSA